MSPDLVVIYPDLLKFNGDIKTEKISIVNPLEYTISYSLKCTNPLAFEVKQDQGEILPNRSLDILIHLIDKNVSQEKFQVRIYAGNRKRKLTEKVIIVINRSGVYDKDNQIVDQGVNEHFQQLRIIKKNVNNVLGIEQPTGSNNIHEMNQFPNAFFIYFLFGVCIVILYLPHEEMKNSLISFAQTTVTCKIVAGFVLGMITTFFLLKNRQ